MRDAAGAEHDNGGEYLEVVAPERLVFTWVLKSESGEVVMEAHRTLSLIPTRDKTK